MVAPAKRLSRLTGPERRAYARCDNRPVSRRTAVVVKAAAAPAVSASSTYPHV